LDGKGENKEGEWNGRGELLHLFMKRRDKDGWERRMWDVWRKGEEEGKGKIMGWELGYRSHYKKEWGKGEKELSSHFCEEEWEGKG
jgi:hypothetical protein